VFYEDDSLPFLGWHPCVKDIVLLKFAPVEMTNICGALFFPAAEIANSANMPYGQYFATHEYNTDLRQCHSFFVKANSTELQSKCAPQIFQ
jgi:hypothetical protein